MLAESPVRESDGQTRQALVEEGRVLGRYLLREVPEPGALERYAAACPKALTRPATASDLAVLRYVLCHPWSLPLLDAVSGLVEPNALLRKKLFLMLSILETFPAHSAVFTAPPRGKWGVLARVACLGVLGVALLLVGLPLYAWARRAR